jgi:predicted RNA-binding Zn-ribbon protein involved in translation (DUF1610 family)
MPERVPRCPTCNGEMELGHTVAFSAVKWVPGKPDIYSASRALPVTTYRCPDCGYLASYAPAPTP